MKFLSNNRKKASLHFYKKQENKMASYYKSPRSRDIRLPPPPPMPWLKSKKGKKSSALNNKKNEEHNKLDTSSKDAVSESSSSNASSPSTYQPIRYRDCVPDIRPPLKKQFPKSNGSSSSYNCHSNCRPKSSALQQHNKQINIWEDHCIALFNESPCSDDSSQSINEHRFHYKRDGTIDSR